MPNPFTENTRIEFSNAAAHSITLRLLDGRGALVRELETRSDKFELYREGLPAGSAATAGGGASVAIAIQPLTARTRGRVLAGSVLFVLGFSVVFVSYGLLFGALGGWLLTYQATLSRLLGLMVIAMGLAFLGLIPGMQREWRVHRSLEVGLWSAPLLGVLFGLGWSPCLGPTIGAVQTLALTEASAARGALLSFAYCLGLGLPFIAVGLAFRRGLGAIGWVKRHYIWVMRLGGGMLVLIGVLLVTGVWEHLMLVLRAWVAGYGVSL